MKYVCQNLKNCMDFFLRNKFSFSRKNYYEPNETKEGLFKGKSNYQSLIEREKELFEKYDLNYLKANSTVQNYLENLYTIDILDKHLQQQYTDSKYVLDIGSKNWSYVKGEYFFFKKYCKKLHLDGIEIDVNRLYTNFFTRREVALFHIQNLEDCNYIFGDFLQLNEKYDYIVWFLPFVFEEPLLKWGLPHKYFNPEKMLNHAYDSLNENGTIFILNQGKVEFEEQKNLCEKLNISYTPIGEVKSIFFTYNIPGYLILINK